MAFEKRYTAKQAAEAVLKKAQEVLAKSEIMKAEKMRKDGQTLGAAIGFPGAAPTAPAPSPTPVSKGEMEKCGTFSKVHEKARREGYSEASADKIAGKAKAMEKGETENPKKENAKPSEHNSKDASQPANGPAPKGEIHPKEHVEGKSDDVRSTPAPGNNPKEQAEGNNELAGTTPTQVGQDGKNVPGFDEMKGHLKLAKFCGHMEAMRKVRKGMSNG